MIQRSNLDFSSGFANGFGSEWFTTLGVSGLPSILYGDLDTKVAAPIFVGTIPDISVTYNTGTYQYDYSTYFTGATSYSISPAVEAGWSFNSSTGVLEIDTDDINTFGPYTITGTNAGGDTASNTFSVTISAVVEEGGGDDTVVHLPKVYEVYREKGMSLKTSKAEVIKLPNKKTKQAKESAADQGKKQVFTLNLELELIKLLQLEDQIAKERARLERKRQLDERRRLEEQENIELLLLYLTTL